MASEVLLDCWVGYNLLHMMRMRAEAKCIQDICDDLFDRLPRVQGFVRSRNRNNR